MRNHLQTKLEFCCPPVSRSQAWFEGEMSMQKTRYTGNTSPVRTTCTGFRICLRLISDAPLPFDNGVFLHLSNFMVWYIRLTLEVSWLLNILWWESKSLEESQEQFSQRILVTVWRRHGSAPKHWRLLYFPRRASQGILLHLELMQTRWVPLDLQE